MLSAVLAVCLGLREIGVIIFQILVLIAMSKLAMDVRIVFAWLRRFLLHCTLARVTVVFRCWRHAGE